MALEKLPSGPTLRFDGIRPSDPLRFGRRRQNARQIVLLASLTVGISQGAPQDINRLGEVVSRFTMYRAS